MSQAGLEEEKKANGKTITNLCLCCKILYNLQTSLMVQINYYLLWAT